MKHLGLIGAALPLVLLAIGMIGWVLTVRNDVTDAVKQITAVQEEVAAINERMETDLVLANDQMATIMGDHLGFADELRELGENGVLPTGEHRDYGGYGNR